VLVRLEVQVAAADRAESRAVGPAEDLLGKLERDHVARPPADIQTVVGHVLGVALVGGARVRVVELAGVDLDLDGRMAEAAHTGAEEVHGQREAEHRGAGHVGDVEPRGDRVRRGFVALAAEEVRIDLDVERQAPHLARPQPQRAEIERGHARSVTPPRPEPARRAIRAGPLAQRLVAYASIMEPDRWQRLDLRHLVALKAIADEGSFGRAADALGYTQSAVSQQIATLERAVGMRLIERPGGPRPISLTEAGAILLRHAEAIDARLRAAKADMEALRAGEAGRLRIGTFQSVGARVLPTLLRRFKDAYPEVDVSLQESAHEDELLELVERGELELTFNMLPLPPGPFENVELLRDPHVLVVPASSPLASSVRPPSLREIALQPLIGFGRCRATEAVEAQLSSFGRTPNVVFRSDNNGTVQGLVGAGVGVCVAPLLTVDEDDPTVAVIDLAGRIPPRVIALVWHRDRHRSPAASAFVETARSVCDALSVEPAAA
jgi:DNA-binding transcriptional LysR family regulator